jgi:hypothetical protein
MKIKAILKSHQIFFFILFSFHAVTLPTTLTDSAASGELERIDPAVFTNRDRYPLLFLLSTCPASHISAKMPGENRAFLPISASGAETIPAQAGQAKTTGRG